MEQLRQQNAQEKNLNRILGAEETLLDLETENSSRKMKKEKITLLKM